MIVWIVLGIVAIAVWVALSHVRRRHDSEAHFGSVSDRWVNEHRLGHSQDDSQR